VSEGLLTVHRVQSCTGVQAGVRGDRLCPRRDAMARRLLAAERYDVAHFVFSSPPARCFLPRARRLWS
jgi:hypothetical protein